MFFTISDIWTKPDIISIYERCDKKYMTNYNVYPSTKWKQCFGTDSKILYETDDNILELDVLNDEVIVHPTKIKQLFNMFNTVTFINGTMQLERDDAYAVIDGDTFKYYEKKFIGHMDLVDLL